MGLQIAEKLKSGAFIPSGGSRGWFENRQDKKQRSREA